MIFGFNTNVRVGEQLFHVQTEDSGPQRAVIETLVFAQGRIVYRHITSYQALLGQDGWMDTLRWKVEEQHGAVIEGLRDGTLELALPAQPAGLAVQLLNPASWLAGGTARLEVEVKSLPDSAAVADAEVRVWLEGASGPLEFLARTDEGGRAVFSFPMPRLGPAGTDLVIRASSPAGGDEIRYTLRPKAKDSAAAERAAPADTEPAPPAES